MPSLETKPLLLDVHRITLRVTHEEFEKLCQDNPDLRLELTEDGQLITMAPAGWESSKRNSKLNSRVDVWNEQIDLGEVFDSSGGFTLPNGAVRSRILVLIRSIFNLILKQCYDSISIRLSNDLSNERYIFFAH